MIRQNMLRNIIFGPDSTAIKSTDAQRQTENRQTGLRIKHKQSCRRINMPDKKLSHAERWTGRQTERRTTKRTDPR